MVFSLYFNSMLRVHLEKRIFYRDNLKFCLGMTIFTVMSLSFVKLDVDKAITGVGR
jgi:hypothetical protein